MLFRSIVGGIIFAILFFATLGLGILPIIILILAIIYILAVIIFFSIANTIFNTALYYYADTGKVPHGYHKDAMDKAFAKKQKK